MRCGVCYDWLIVICTCTAPTCSPNPIVHHQSSIELIQDAESSSKENVTAPNICLITSCRIKHIINSGDILHRILLYITNPKLLHQLALANKYVLVWRRQDGETNL